MTAHPAPQGTARIRGVARPLTFSLHPGNDKHISSSIAGDGTWEPFETEVVRRLLTAPHRDRPLFVDCGANLGWYTVVAAALGADVVACEPLPANAALLRRNVADNRMADNRMADDRVDGRVLDSRPETRVEVHEVALGEHVGTGVLRLSADNQGDHRIDPATTAGGAGSRPGIEVAMTTLDAVLAGRRPDVLKIDTQGSEVAILRGGRTAWQPGPGRRDPSIVLELWPYGLRCAGAHEDELLALIGPLVDTTHRCFEVREWSATLAPLSADDVASMVSVGGFSAAMKGFTNLALIAVDRVAAIADLIEPDPGQSAKRIKPPPSSTIV